MQKTFYLTELETASSYTLVLTFTFQKKILRLFSRHCFSLELTARAEVQHYAGGQEKLSVGQWAKEKNKGRKSSHGSECAVKALHVSNETKIDRLLIYVK